VHRGKQANVERRIKRSDVSEMQRGMREVGALTLASSSLLPCPHYMEDCIAFACS